jgi:fatty acyl-CoA reductase
MKKACPDYMNKVRVVAGDCGLPGLGLAEADRELLCQEVNIVFHVAATVRFDEKLRTAVYINVRSTKYMLELARHMLHLKVQSQSARNRTRSSSPELLFLLLLTVFMRNP